MQRPRITDLPGIWRKNFRRFLLRASLVLLVVLLYIASTINNISNERRMILSDIQRITRATTQSAQLHTQAIIDATINTLQALRADINNLQDSGATQRLLDDHFFGSPYLRTTIVLDSDGTNIASNFRELLGATGVGYQFFEVHRRAIAEGAFTGDILVGRVSQSAHFVSSIALRDAAQRFRGVVAAAYELAYFQQLYEKLAPDTQYDVALYHAREGLVVAGDSVITEGSLPSSSKYPLHLLNYDSSFHSITVPGRQETPVLAFSLPLREGQFHIVTFADVSELMANHVESNRVKYLLAGLFVTTVLVLMIVVELHSAGRHMSEMENTKLEQDLRRAQKLEALGTLAGGLAHDFNNLLSSIIGFAEIARERLGSGQVADKALQQVLLACRRAESMVERIFTFSQRAESRSVPFQLLPIVSESIELVRISVSPSIQITLHANAITSWLSGDPSEMHQLTTNLCMNAAHAMPEGGMLDITLENRHLNEPQADSLGLVQPGLHLRLSIRDTGIGIAPEIRERMFDPFYTTKAHGKGSGLGLSIVHRIVEEQNGAIEVTSAIGEGTEFAVWLPTIEEPHDTAASPDSFTKIDGDGQVAVCVDDDEAIVGLLEERLASFGFEPRGFTDGEVALRQFEEPSQKIALLITDYAMPNISGIALASRVRTLRPDLPIILITGFSTKDVIKSAKALKSCEVVRKPLRANKLAHAISRCIPESAGTKRAV